MDIDAINEREAKKQKDYVQNEIAKMSDFQKNTLMISVQDLDKYIKKSDEKTDEFKDEVLEKLAKLEEFMEKKIKK